MRSAELLRPEEQLRPDDGTAGEPRSAATGALRPQLPVALAVLALGLWAVAVSEARFSRMGDAGLSSVLGWPYWAAIAAVVTGFVVELTGRQRSSVLVGVIAALVVILFGTASAVEPLARLPDSWITTGFVRYIATHGQVLRFSDARFYWPGMFSMTALVDTAMGRSSATDLIRWAPLAFELLYLPPLLLIRKAANVSPQAGWLGVVIFYLGNWVEQDYFSPQAVNLIFLLVIVGVVLHGWQPRPPADPTLAWIKRIPWGRGMLGEPRYGPAVTAVLSVLVALLAAASVASHQLTPVAIFFALVAFAFTRRLPNLEILLLVPLLIAAWILFAATDYWEYGKEALILGDVGHVGSSVSSGVGQRVTGSAVHRFITDLRICIAAGVLGLAALGGLLRRGKSRTLELLALLPFAILALQSYGGEATLRAYLYALPFAALLGAELIARVAGLGRPETDPGGVPKYRRARLGGLAVALGLAAGLLTFVRGGNDPYVAATVDDRQAVTTVYRAAQPNETIADLEPYVPWQDQGMGEWYFLTVPTVVRDGQLQRVQLGPIPPSWVVLTTAQERYGEIVDGLQPGWEAQAEQLLIAQYHYRVYWSRGGATVLQGPLDAAQIEKAKQRLQQRLHHP